MIEVEGGWMDEQSRSGAAADSSACGLPRCRSGRGRGVTLNSAIGGELCCVLLPQLHAPYREYR